MFWAYNNSVYRFNDNEYAHNLIGYKVNKTSVSRIKIVEPESFIAFVLPICMEQW